MKIVFRLSLLITFTICFISCKSGMSYQDYYNSANKSYNNRINFNKPKPQKAKTNKWCSCENNNAEYYTYITSITNNVNSMNTTIDKLEQENVLVKKKLNEDSSNEITRASKETSVVSTPTTTNTQQAVVRQQTAVRRPTERVTITNPEPTKKQEESQASKNSNMPVRKLAVNAINSADESNLRKYNVVIATLEKKDNLIKLTNALKKAGEKTVVVKSPSSMHYVLMGSYDNEIDAQQRSNEIHQKYLGKQTPQQLFKTYGIPFSDIWILDREQ